MGQVVPARICYQVHTARLNCIQQAEIDDVMQRHPLRTGYLEVVVIDGQSEQLRCEQLTPRYRDFHPAIEFEQFAVVHRSRWIYCIEAREVEPEDLGYLRAAMLIAGELAALTQGVIIDPLAHRAFMPETILQQIEGAFDPLDHVSLHVEQGDCPLWVHTHGLEKFAHADLQIFGVPLASRAVALDLLKHAVAAIVSGGSFRPGESTQLGGFAFEFQPASESDDRHFSADVLTLARFRLLEQTSALATEGMLELAGTRTLD